MKILQVSRAGTKARLRMKKCEGSCVSILFRNGCCVEAAIPSCRNILRLQIDIAWEAWNTGIMVIEARALARPAVVLIVDNSLPTVATPATLSSSYRHRANHYNPRRLFCEF
jgi:hypothetical protein